MLLRDDDARPTAAPVLLQPAQFTTATLGAAPTETATIVSLAATVTPTPLPTETVAPPTEPPTSTPLPPSATHTATTVPPTNTAAPPPPTETPLPTDTPVPSFAFDVVENEQFFTGKPDFDVFIGVTNGDNQPLAGYRVLTSHSAGIQMETNTSAGDWTENSGANHYKAGNIKYNFANSPDGVWTLQLIDEAGQPVAAPLEIPFDTSNPAWYFVLYRQN